jgi:hypothetical protein
MVRQPGERSDLVVAPEAEAVVGDASLRNDSRGFHDDEPCAPESPGTVVEEMKFRGNRIRSAVHAHGGHDDPVFENKILDFKRFVGLHEEQASFMTAWYGESRVSRKVPFCIEKNAASGPEAALLS